MKLNILVVNAVCILIGTIVLIYQLELNAFIVFVSLS